MKTTMPFSNKIQILAIGFVVPLLAVRCGKEPYANNQVDSVLNSPEAPLFTLLRPEQTHVDFVNNLKEGLNTNILMYEYFYNGGGVAAGDMNGDGLVDLYFSSNMGLNKLYINKGDLEFIDVTKTAGVEGRDGPWKTGVALADVNGDNMLDVYVCYSGMLPDEKRTNQLFINKGNDEQGIPRFEEEAAQYGLASVAFSNQSYFFDYDLDGDLDMLLLNHNPKSLPVLNEVSTKEYLKTDDPMRGVRLFRQTDGHFQDVTVAAGISGSPLTYGLGIGISDVNNDGWLDFYVSNDYTIPDYLYINNTNGTFTDKLQECIGHNSHFSMGNDIADVNNDGWSDVLTLDMLPEDNHRQKLLLAPDNYGKFELNIRTGFHYQYMRNMLQLNNGNGSFSEVGQFAGISNTDWSWAALLADYDNDGWKDVFITNGYLRDYTNLDFIKYMDDYVRAKGRLRREDVLDLVARMPSSNVVNYVFSNDGKTKFVNKTAAWGMSRPSNSNGAAYADLDNDGDLDLIVNNINEPAFIYRNESRNLTTRHFIELKLQGEGKNTQGVGAKVVIATGGKRQTIEQLTSRGYLSSVPPVLHFGLGEAETVDSLTIIWPGGKRQILTGVRADQTITMKENEAFRTREGKSFGVPLYAEIPSPVKFREPESRINDFKRQSLMINPMSFSGPVVVKGDVNNDGMDDILIGGCSGQAAVLFVQEKEGRFVRQSIPEFEKDALSEDAAVAFFDANGDSYTDIYIASGGYHHFDWNDPSLQDRLYLNDGRGNFKKDKNALPEMLVSKGCVVPEDFNGDGRMDLFVGGRVIPGRYPERPASYILINDGKGHFIDKTHEMSPELQKIGMVTDAVCIDLNRDGKNELVVVGEWLPVTIFENVGGKLQNKSGDYLEKPYVGFWNRIATADFNQDQTPDLIVGNMGTNTQFQVSETEPAELYFGDYDNNGSIDPIFCFYVGGRSFPFATRDEFLEQLAVFRSRFTTYKSFADATMEDLFGPEELGLFEHLEANCMETTLFLSGTNGKFRASPLPLEVQYSPVFTITPFDFDNDGSLDVLLCGNINHASLRLGKFDANYGILLQGDGKGKFKYIRQSHSGFHLNGDVRSVVRLNKTLLFGLNQKELKAYRYNDVPQ